MKEGKSTKSWPGEPPGLWPAPEPKPRAERRTDAEREETIRAGVRIDHALSRSVGPKLVEFVKRPWEPHQRWRGLLLVGPASSGRSWLVSRWLSERSHGYRGAIVAQMPSDVAGDKILRAVAEAGDENPSWLSAHEVRHEAMRRLGEATVVVFDGCDHLALLRKPKLQRLLAKIKCIAEHRRVPVIMIANPRLLEAIVSDPDWEGRFEVLHFPRWRVDRDFLDLLTTWEDALPLEKNSHLAEREMALHLYSLCDGSIARLAEVLRKGTLRAIDNAHERITIRLLDSLGFSPPATFRQFLF